MSTTTTDAGKFDHFLKAQDGGVFERALEEISAGKKRSHWMWFVFPQLTGLGRSDMAQTFGLDGQSEARDYLRDPELGSRLVDATEAMLEWGGTMPAETILGSTDAMKFRSSMTLFEAAAADDDSEVFAAAIEAFYDGERCPLTLERL
ncbi:MAG: DUF1810 domain-containing protein [Citromicrobium sp.]|nr:MAG: DUF1810 domain-containing protein [Citromicrobium sp.]